MEEIRRSRRCAFRKSENVEGCAHDSQRKETVGEDPESHKTGTERFVRIFQCLLCFFLGSNVWCEGALDGFLELGVDVCLCHVHFLYDVSFTVGGFLNRSRWQGVGFVGALGSPGDVVPVAEGVHHQNIDVRRHQQKVLAEGGEHVPWVEIEEGSDEVKTEGRGDGDKDNTRAAGREERFENHVCIFAVEA